MEIKQEFVEYSLVQQFSHLKTLVWLRDIFRYDGFYGIILAKKRFLDNP